MPQEITMIRLAGVNCYLLAAGDGKFILVDSGLSMGRGRLLKALEQAGCQPGKLSLVLITHADSDHTGSAAYLRRRYGAKIALHPAEVKAAESGNMLDDRKKQGLLTRLAFSLFKPAAADRFSPDFTVEDGQDLSTYGLPGGRVVGLPGHTFGSIGVLVDQGDPSQGSGQVLLCGDMLMMRKSGPRVGYGNPADFKDSLEKLKAMPVRMFYPGHGDPFSKEVFLKAFWPD